MDLAHLGHLEMLTPKPEESLRFFVDVLGMTESGRQGDSVYLRGWDDYERHTLEADGVEAARHGPRGFSRAQPAGAGTSSGRAQRLGLRHRMDRRRSGARPGLRLPGSRRTQDRAVLRDAVV